MKDIVDNRRRIGLFRKLRILGLVMRENGIAWTTCFTVYYLASSLAEKAYGAMDRLRHEKSLPGLNSVKLNAEIWNQWDWSAGGEEWTQSEDWKRSLLKNVLQKHVPPKSRILEIGPGGGRWTEHLLPLAEHLSALDISQTCVDRCRERFSSFENAEFKVTDGSSLEGVDDGSIDVIWSFDVFVHINSREVEKYAAEFSRVLKPGGKGIIHHGTLGGKKGGWRSDMTADRFSEILESHSLAVTSQFKEWEDQGTTFQAGLYEDTITMFEKGASAAN